MLRTIGALSLVLSLVASSALAQKQGMINNNAPTCSSSIAFGEKASIELKYTAITWGQGNWFKALSDPARGERARDRLAKTAEASPLGELKTSAECTIGGKKVGAGTWKLYFTMDKDLKWHLNLAKDQEKIDWVLDLKEGSESTRLGLSLGAGKEDGSAELTVQFGTAGCKVPVSAGAAAEKK